MGNSSRVNAHLRLPTGLAPATAHKHARLEEVNVFAKLVKVNQARLRIHLKRWKSSEEEMNEMYR